MKNTMRALLPKATAAAIAALAGLCLSAFSFQTAAPAPRTGPRTFDTPQQAADALVQAATADDVAAIVAIFGPAAKDIVPSGDPVQDKNDIERFAAKAGEKLEISFSLGNPNQAGPRRR